MDQLEKKIKSDF